MIIRIATFILAVQPSLTQGFGYFTEWTSVIGFESIA